MSRNDPDRLRNACAVIALYLGASAVDALEPSARQVAGTLALIGLWFALLAAFDVMARVSEDTAS